MVYLFIDTSDIDVSIGVIKDSKILSYKSESVPNKHSVYTTSYLKEMLDKAGVFPEDIDKILVVNGPGSFTGVRIGVTIAKVYAYLVKCEIVSVSSLKILALSSNNSDYYMSLLDAKHDNYYVGIYDKDYNDIVEKFCSKEEVNYYIDKYNPLLVSNKDFEMDSNVVNKVNLDLISIVNYYKDKKDENVHLVNPNYLKLPQVMEK